MKNLFNNISQEEKNRILEMHLGNKRVISENINIITENKTIASEFQNLAKSSLSKELKVELENLLTSNFTFVNTDYKILNTADEIIAAMKDSKLTVSGMKTIVTNIINTPKGSKIREYFIKSMVSSDKYQNLFKNLTRDEAKKVLGDKHYTFSDDILDAYEKVGKGKFKESSSVGSMAGKETKVAATKEVEQSLHTFNDLSERAKQYFDTISKDAKFNSEQIELINKGARRLLNTVFFKLSTGDRYALTNLLKGLEVDLKTVENALIAQKQNAISTRNNLRAANIDKFLKATQNNLKLLSEVSTFIVATPFKTLAKIGQATKGTKTAALGGAFTLVIGGVLAGICVVAYKLFKSDNKVKDVIKVGADVVKQVNDARTDIKQSTPVKTDSSTLTPVKTNSSTQLPTDTTTIRD